MRAGPDPGRLVHPVGPGEHRGDAERGPHRAAFVHGDLDGVGPVDHGVLRRRGVVVGVAVVAGVDEPSVPGDPVDGERPVVLVDHHGDQPVGDRHPRAGGPPRPARCAVLARCAVAGRPGFSGCAVPGHPDRVLERGRLEVGPSEPRNLRLASEDAPHRVLVEDHPDLGLRPGGEPGVELPLDLLHRHSLTGLGPGGHDDLEPVLVLGQGDIGDVGVGVEPRSLDEPQQVADRLAVEGERPGERGSLGDDLDIGTGLARCDHHHLDQAGAVACGGVHRQGAGGAHRGGQGAQGLLGQAIGDVTGLGVAVEHGVHHLVGRAGTDRVVGGVADHQCPRQVEERVRSGTRGEEQGAQRLG